MAETKVCSRAPAAKGLATPAPAPPDAAPNPARGGRPRQGRAGGGPSRAGRGGRAHRSGSGGQAGRRDEMNGRSEWARRHQTQSCSTLGAAHWDGLLAGLEAPERRVDLRPGRPVVLSVEVALGHGDQLLPVRGDADLTGAPDAL
ncbi:unnamed protein product [Prorocentrum cordatum]|uniref:Uncharacterized protein n=1 Tax=Prorocentrum cordatum TaxID=2364126 RepID=A0ABN9QF00_9DINO|nr:unnamed protein product [Polarella glacialis]